MSEKKKRNFSISYTGEMEEMTNYIMEKTGVNLRSQAFAMAIKQYYLSLKEDEKSVKIQNGLPTIN